MYGNNGLRFSDYIPQSLYDELRKYNEKREKITSVTFNDAGDWVVITTEHFSGSSQEIQDWLREGADAYGFLYAACVTNDAAIAVYADGCYSLGTLPDGLGAAIRRADFDIYRVKMTKYSWFIANKSGYRYDYHM